MHPSPRTLGNKSKFLASSTVQKALDEIWNRNFLLSFGLLTLLLFLVSV